MNISVKYLVIGTCVLAAMCVSSSAVEFKDLAISVSSTEEQWLIPGLQGGQSGMGPVKPTYMARLYVFNPKVDLPQFMDVLATQTGKTLSQAQQDLMFTGQGVLGGYEQWRSVGAEGQPGPYGQWGAGPRPAEYEPSGVHIMQPAVPNFTEVRLYAVSSEDANAVVKAYVEALNAATKVSQRATLNQLERCHNNRANAQRRLAEIQSEMQDIVENRGVALSPEDVSRIMSTTAELRNSLEIDIAGLNARIEAIMRYLSSKETGPESRPRLQQMLIDHNVELAGVLAKLKATDAARDKAEQKYMLSLRIGELRKESDELRAQLMKAEQQREEAESNHRKAQDEVIHPQIFQNKATIYPVKTESEEPISKSKK